MALNIKNAKVEKLLEDVVQITGESKTEAVRKALEERRRRLALESVRGRGEKRLYAFLEDEIWPLVTTDLVGSRLTKAEEERILGYGEIGV